MKRPGGVIANSTVAALAAESKHAEALAGKWVTARKVLVASCGWSTYSHHVSITANEDINVSGIKELLDEVAGSIHGQPNLIKEAMNGLVISVGCFVPELIKAAKATARKMGEVVVDHGKTACKTPDALAYIEKVEGMGRLGKKKRAARC